MLRVTPDSSLKKNLYFFPAENDCFHAFKKYYCLLQRCNKVPEVY
jgi:hypothetical protein